MLWAAIGFIVAGALIGWLASLNQKAAQKEKDDLDNALIRGTEMPVPRTLLVKVIGALLAGIGMEIAAILLLFGILGLFASI